MAPFLTHLVVGERVWGELDGRRPGGRAGYGVFLSGCLAPDVDKLCEDLEQATSHFLAKDGGNRYMWERSQYFLDHQVEFLRVPFPALAPAEQAFVLGYLCHVATDEMTGRLGAAIKGQVTGRGGAMPQVDAIFSALDPEFWGMASDPAGIVAALEAAAIPYGTFPAVPPDALDALYRIVLPQVREGGGLDPCLRMFRRQSQWLRHGRVSDAADDPELEAGLAAFRRTLKGGMPAAVQLVASLDLAPFVEEAMRHSLDRIGALSPTEVEQ